MRFRKFVFAAGPGLPFLLAALTAQPVDAQFREILPDATVQPRIEIQLAPTRQSFVPPKPLGLESAPEPIPATPPTDAGWQSEARVSRRDAQHTPSRANSARNDAELNGIELNSAALNPVAEPSLHEHSHAEPTLAERTAAKPDSGTEPPSQPEPEPALAQPAPAAISASVEPQGTAAEPLNLEAPAAEEPTAASPSDIPTSPAQPANPFAAFERKASGSSAAGLLDTARSQAPTPPAITATGPLVFNQIVPGESTLAEAIAKWGKPVKDVVDAQGRQLIYRAPGFRQVNLLAASDGDTISSVLVHLNEPMAIEDLVKQLELTSLRAVEITDDREELKLGRGYAERGLLMTYVDGQADSPLVSQLVLEPVSGDLFRLRAEKANDRKHLANLADLEEAVRLNPQDAKAAWLQAELLSLIGRNDDAWNSVGAATRIAPDNPLYRLTYARLNAGRGNLVEAIAVTQTIAEDSSVPGIVRARAEYQWGNLLAVGPEADPQDAITHHLKAIELAAKHVRSTHGETRRMAKDILVDAHLAVAQDIAVGNFQRQREVVPRWLTRATELAEDFIEEDAGDETMRMEIYRTTLAVYSVLDGDFDASIATDEAIKEGQRLVAQANDRLYQFQVERELSETLYHAARVEQRCGRWKSAQQYASNAVVLLEGEKTGLQPSLFDKVMAGQLYYLTGSICALQEEDHREAAEWYAKAMPTFENRQLGNLVDTSGFGDLLVSMGVSFWESGQKEEAVRLTQRGAEMMQQGVEAGSIDLIALSVPYGNLAAMHQDLGNTDKAKHFATMLAKVEKDARIQ